jgi:HK97 family phage major capsid protein
VTDNQKIINESREIYNKTNLTLRKVNPLAWNRLCDDTNNNGPQHPAGMRREANKCRQEYNAILQKAEGRELTQDEFKALECLAALDNLWNAQADQQRDLDENFTAIDALGGNPQDGKKRLFAKGEKMAMKHKPGHLEDVNLGGVMAAMLGVDSARRNPNIQNAMSVGTDSAGGYSVPIELLLEFVDLLRAKSVLFAAGARTLVLDTMKTNLATLANDPAPGWWVENAPVAETDATLGNVQFQPKSLMCIVRLSRELLQDSLNITEILMSALAGALAAQVDYSGLYGSGSAGQPQGLDGVLTAASRVTTLATNGAKLSANGNYKPILQACNQVAAVNDEATAIILNPRTEYDLAALADTTGQPLQQPKAIADMQLLDTTSVPVNLTVGTASGVCSELFVGNFTNLVLGLRESLHIRVLNEAYATSGQFGIEASMRVDWKAVRPNSFWKVRGILAE